MVLMERDAWIFHASPRSRFQTSIATVHNRQFALYVPFSVFWWWKSGFEENRLFLSEVSHVDGGAVVSPNMGMRSLDAGHSK